MAKFSRQPLARMMMVRLPHSTEKDIVAPDKVCLHRIWFKAADEATASETYLGGLWVPFVTNTPQPDIKEAFLWSGYDMISDRTVENFRMLALVRGTLVKGDGADSRLAKMTDGQEIILVNPLIDYTSQIVHTQDIAEEVTRLMVIRRPELKKAGPSGSDLS